MIPEPVKFVFACAMVVGALCVSSQVMADDEPGFGPCKPGSSHASVPRFGDVSYDQARKKLLAAGWMPRVTREPDGTLADDSEGARDLWGNGPVFWSRGYTEVENCAGTGLAWCEFNFVDEKGNRLKIVTAGEEDPEGSYHAVVSHADLLCRR
jgi:hypothetical protein